MHVVVVVLAMLIAYSNDIYCYYKLLFSEVCCINKTDLGLGLTRMLENTILWTNIVQ